MRDYNCKSVEYESIAVVTPLTLEIVAADNSL